MLFYYINNFGMCILFWLSLLLQLFFLDLHTLPPQLMCELGEKTDLVLRCTWCFGEVLCRSPHALTHNLPSNLDHCRVLKDKLRLTVVFLKYGKGRKMVLSGIEMHTLMCVIMKLEVAKLLSIVAQPTFGQCEGAVLFPWRFSR